MKEPPIPPLTIANLCAALGDALRVAMVFGDEQARGTATDQSYQYVTQYAVQLMALSLQRMPTPAEVDAVFSTDHTRPAA